MLYVVRHGKTGFNETKRTMGRMDIPLSGIGEQEAEVLKEKLEEDDIDLIISSPLIRAKETAMIINKSKNVELKFDERITERFLGFLEGRNYTQDNNEIWDINVNTKEYNVETMSDFKDRVYNFLDETLEEYKDKNVLLVTHGGVSALINCYFNNTLFDGSISDKFLENGEVASYETNSYKKVKKYEFKLED